MNKWQKYVLAILLATLSWTSPAQAWLRPRYEDAQVVERSELIVVGAIKDGSVVVVPHKSKPGDGISWETEAKLVIHGVVKGKTEEKEIPITIQYGLAIMIDGNWTKIDHDSENMVLPNAKKSMTLEDSGGKPMPESSFWKLGDVRTDHIWCLRHQTDTRRSESKDFQVADPEDIKPLNQRSYIESYLLPEPEPALRNMMQKQPELAEAIGRYLAHCEIGRILKEPEPAKRVEKLLPYYRSSVSWGMRQEAREGIIAAGELAGPYLMAIYKGSDDEYRNDTIRIWGKIKYRAAVPVLIELLKREDLFWAQQKLQPGWWNTEPNEARRKSYGLIYDAINALGEMGDARASQVIIATRERWSGLKVETEQIVEACDQAIKKLAIKN